MKHLKYSIVFISLFILLFSNSILAQENQENSFIFEKDGTEYISPEGMGIKRDYSSAKTQQTEELPSSYDLRNFNGKNYVPPVENQGPFGTCWAFAAMNSSESNAMLKGASDNISLSEKA